MSSRAREPRCSEVHGIFTDQGSNPHLLHWQADSLSPGQEGSPKHFMTGHGLCFFFKKKTTKPSLGKVRYGWKCQPPNPLTRTGYTKYEAPCIKNNFKTEQSTEPRTDPSVCGALCLYTGHTLMKLACLPLLNFHTTVFYLFLALLFFLFFFFYVFDV